MTHAEQLIRALRKTRWSERELNLLRELYPVEDTELVAARIGRRLQAGWTVERALSSMPRIASKVRPDGLKRWKVVRG